MLEFALLGFNIGGFLLGTALFLVTLFLILLILVQRGKGGGLAGALGGMGGESALGTRAGDVFTKITVITALIWILLCMLTYKIYEPPKLPTADSVGPSMNQGGPSDGGDGSSGQGDEVDNGTTTLEPEGNPAVDSGFSGVPGGDEPPTPEKSDDEGTLSEDSPEEGSTENSTPDEPESPGEETGDGNSDQ